MSKIKSLVKALANYVGLEIRRTNTSKPSSNHHTSDQFRTVLEAVRSNTMVPREGLASLYDQVRFVELNRIEGEFVECGVWKGGAVGVMALANLRYGSCRRHVHLFDSFEEICEPDSAVDGDRAIREVKQWTKNGGTEGKLVPLKGIYDHKGGPGTIADCKNLLVQQIGYKEEYIHFYQGWFQDTLPHQYKNINKIAILRIDADWYASTKICLEYLFSKVVSGGFVIIDDYGAYDGCRKAVDEYLQSIASPPLYLNYVNSDIRYLIVR